ncbi:MAG TPA: alanine--glyoxylate aminotransferase family protein, partial [Firmicutes bacterium]|nr:alanine--glyoxylate aminotransferase family protein [Bacillota bacterium]
MPEHNLLIPGPTPIPPEVSRAMSSEMFNHRGPRFKALQERLTEGLKKVFQTGERLYILTASGTGAMEASIVNFFSPGDKIICLTNGSFGERLADIAGIFGLQVERITVEWGKPLDYKALEERINADQAGSIKA